MFELVINNIQLVQTPILNSYYSSIWILVRYLRFLPKFVSCFVGFFGRIRPDEDEILVNDISSVARNCDFLY